MKKPHTAGTVLLLLVLCIFCVFGAGCVNTDITDPGKIIPEIPPQDHPPVTLQPIVGEWDGYDTETKTTYEALFLYSGYAKLELETKQSGGEKESVFYGAWEGENPNYQVKLDFGNYRLTITEAGKTALLTTPDGRNVTLNYDSY